LHELEQEEALATECEITDLDPPQNRSRALNPWLHGQNLSWWKSHRTTSQRRCYALDQKRSSISSWYEALI